MRSSQSDTSSLRRMNVMFVGPYPPPYSGPELGMKQFLESSLSQVFRIRFVKTNIRANNAEKGRINFTSAFWVLWFHLRFLWSLIAARPKLIYYPITATAAGWVARDVPCIIASRLFGCNVVIHLRAGHLRLNYRRFPGVVKRLVKFACSRVSIAIVQAECLRNQFEGLVPEQRIKVLPQAIDTAEYEAGPAQPGRRNQILFLGNLAYSKGYCDLVRALPAVAQAMPDVKFVFCGSIVEERATGVYFDQSTGEKLTYESAKAAHETVQRSAHAKHYEWRGVVAGKEKLDLLRSSSLIVLPSYSEGFSRALIEAMSVGKPVVCTPVGAHPEFIVDGVHGIHVPPGNVQALAVALISLLSDDARRNAIGAANYRYVRETFDIKIVAKQLEDLFFDAVIRKPN